MVIATHCTILQQIQNLEECDNIDEDDFFTFLERAGRHFTIVEVSIWLTPLIGKDYINRIKKLCPKAEIGY